MSFGGIGYGGGASTAFGTQGTPQFQPISSTKDPTNKNLQFQSDVALFYNIYIEDIFAGQIAVPDGQGPYTASGFLIPMPYPTQAVVNVYDKCGWGYLGSGTII